MSGTLQFTVKLNFNDKYFQKKYHQFIHRQANVYINSITLLLINYCSFTHRIQIIVEQINANEVRKQAYTSCVVEL